MFFFGAVLARWLASRRKKRGSSTQAFPSDASTLVILWVCRCYADKKDVRSARNECVKNESGPSVNVFSARRRSPGASLSSARYTGQVL